MRSRNGRGRGRAGGRGRGVLTGSGEAGRTGPRAGVSGLRLPGSSLWRRRRPRHSCCLQAQPSQFRIPTLLGRAPLRAAEPPLGGRLLLGFSPHLPLLPLLRLLLSSFPSREPQAHRRWRRTISTSHAANRAGAATTRLVPPTLERRRHGTVPPTSPTQGRACAHSLHRSCTGRPLHSLFCACVSHAARASPSPARVVLRSTSSPA